LGAEVIRIKEKNIGLGIMHAAEEKEVTTVCIGKPHLKLHNIILRTQVFNQLLNKLAATEIDLVILS
jgi:two-component system sensor histidine kinase KdpD